MKQTGQQRLRAHRVRARLLLVVSVVVLLMATWVVVGRQLMLRVPEYRQSLERLVEARIRTPLEIDAMSGYMDGAVPVFVFENVRLPAQGAAAPLQIGRVELSVDVLASLASRSLRARQLRVVGIDLHMTRDDSGRIRLTGLEGLGSAQATDARRAAPLDTLLDLVYRQKRLVVENASAVLALPDLPPVAVTDLAVAVVSSGTTHRLALRARGVDRPVTVDARLEVKGDPHTLAEVNGTGYVRLGVAEADPWINAVLPPAWRVADVRGDIQAWLSLQGGKVSAGALDLDIARLAVEAEALTTPLVLEGMQLQAALSQRDQAYLVQLAGVRARHGEDVLSLPRIAARWRPGEQREWQLALRDVDIAAARDLVSGLPVTWPESAAPGMQRLQQLQPAGLLESFALQGQGREVSGFSARFEDIALVAHEKIPGASGVSGWFAGDTDSGVLMLQSPLLELDLPLLFRAPLAVQAFGPLRWQRQPGGVTLQAGWLHAQNSHARGRAAAQVELRPGQVPELSLLASITDGVASEAHRYIPLNKLPEPVAEWLDKAFVDGRAEHGVILHEGPVRIDPDRQQDRTLQVGVRARNLTLHFLEGWPDIRNLSADVVIDGREIRGRAVSGRIFGARLDNATVDIPEYEGDAAPVLVVNARVAGAGADLQGLLQQTALTELLPEELQQWRMPGGSFKGHALMNIPLRAGAGDKTVLVQANVSDLALDNPVRRLSVSAIKGPVRFSLADGIQAPALTAQFWQYPVTARIESKGLKTRIHVDGEADAAALQDWLQAVWMSPLSGRVGYSADLALPGDQADMTLAVAADASRLALALPAPLGKKAGELSSLALLFTVNGARQSLQVSHPDVASAALQLREGELERGHIVIGRGVAQVPGEPGVLITGQVARLAVQDWVDYFSSSQGDAVGGGGFPLRQLAIRATDADIYDVPVANALLKAVPDDTGWDFAVDSDALAATVRMPDGYSARGAVPLDVNVQQVVTTSPADEAAGGDALLQIDPMQVPTARVSIESAVVDNEDYGSWRFLVEPRARGVSLQGVKGTIRGARVTGTLDWLASAGTTPDSHFIGRVESGDVASLLTQWDFDPVLESNDLRALVDVRWPGSPLDIDYLAMQGKVSVEMGKSRFPKTDSKTSALRVLGVFNIGTVSRRLRFDFTDLYKKGLSCDSIGGDFDVNGALLTTQNLVIKSPSAEFRVKGEVNMETETLNNSVEVTLPVSSNLYVGCLAGPAACAGIFVVERLWGDRLEKMTTLGYRVTGSWDNPDVKEVQGLFENSK